MGGVALALTASSLGRLTGGRLTLGRLTGGTLFDDSAAKGVATDALGEFSLILPEGMDGAMDGGGSMLGIDSLLSELVGAVRDGASSTLSLLFLLVGAILLMGIAELYENGATGAIRAGLSILFGGASFLRLIPLLSEARDAFSAIGGFFGSLSAILSSLAASAGAGGLAGSSLGVSSMSLALFGGLTGLLLPLAAVMSGLGVVGSASGTGISATINMARNWFVRGVGIVSALLGGFFALQTAVSAAGDGAALRAIKYAASGSIPVVGGAVSGAISTLAGGVGYAAGIIGGGGAAVIITLALSPLVKLLMYRLAFFIAQLLGDFLSFGSGRAIGAISGGLDALIAVYSLGSVVYITEAVVLMKAIASLV